MFARSRNGARCLTALLAMTAAACADERVTAPADRNGFDAPRANADLGTMQRVLARPSWQSFAALSGRFDLGSAAAAAVAGSRDLLGASAPPSWGTSQRLAAAAAERLLGAAGPHGTLRDRLIPVGSLGKTFVYEPAARRYVAAPERSGAPADGVRFILYAVNPVTGEPIVAQEVGYVDLIDEGAALPSTIALHLLVVSSDVTVLDYHVAIDPSAGALSVAGVVFDGVTRLGFHVAARGRSTLEGSAFDLDFHFAIPDRQFAVAARIRGVQTQTAHAGHVELAVRSGASTINLAVTTHDRSVDAAFVVDGSLFATATGDAQHPDIRGAGGRALTPQEMEALGRIVQLAGDVFGLLGNLLKPLDAALALATVPE